MTLEEAQKVVDRLSFVRFEAEDVDMPHPDHVTLDGIFTAPELEAILVVLRSKATPDSATDEDWCRFCAGADGEHLIGCGALIHEGDPGWKCTKACGWCGRCT